MYDVPKHGPHAVVATGGWQQDWMNAKRDSRFGLLFLGVSEWVSECVCVRTRVCMVHVFISFASCLSFFKALRAKLEKKLLKHLTFRGVYLCWSPHTHRSFANFYSYGRHLLHVYVCVCVGECVFGYNVILFFESIKAG